MKSLRSCMQCGKCTGSCPSGLFTILNTRKMILRANYGLRNEVLSSDELWLCTTCYTCQERCPKEVKITDLIRIMRNMAVEEGYMSEKHRKIGSYFLKTGHAVPIKDEIVKIREELDLSPMPPTTQGSEEYLGELQKIAKKTGFDELIGFGSFESAWR